MLNVRANSFSNRIVNTWNSLIESAVSAYSLNALSQYLISVRKDIHTSSRLHATARTPPTTTDKTNIEIRQKKPEAYILTSNRYEINVISQP